MSTEEKNVAIVQPSLTASEFKDTQKALLAFVRDSLREAKNIGSGDSGDYGVIPFTKKRSLLKPGAEKLLKLFGFVAKNELVKEVEDFEKRFVYYKYRCTITHGATGIYIADATRSCNNKEKKHANKDVYDVANTIEAVAQKRALVAATIQATMASEIFEGESGDYDDTPPNKKTTQEEDPRRSRLTMRLYGTATEHGWTDAWIHVAIKKKWDVESLTNLTNEQIEELTEFIVTTYIPVGKGEKPVLRAETEEEVLEAIDVPEAVPYSCKGSKHDPKKPETMEITTVENPWCSKECQEEFYPPKKDPKEQLKTFLESRKKNQDTPGSFA